MLPRHPVSLEALPVASFAMVILGRCSSQQLLNVNARQPNRTETVVLTSHDPPQRGPRTLFLVPTNTKATQTCTDVVHSLRNDIYQPCQTINYGYSVRLLHVAARCGRAFTSCPWHKPLLQDQTLRQRPGQGTQTISMCPSASSAQGWHFSYLLGRTGDFLPDPFPSAHSIRHHMNLLAVKWWLPGPKHASIRCPWIADRPST